MKTILFFILLLPVTLFGQCDPAGTGTLSANVNGNSVILYNDSVERNCASWYIMEVTQLEGDTLQWIQNDQGGFALCLCHFNLSTTIDSLEPGNWLVKAYYTDSPAPYGDTCYLGTIAFTIEGQNMSNNFIVAGTYQSDCFSVGIDSPPGREKNSMTVIPNPAKDRITIKPGRFNKCPLTILDVHGKKVLETELNGEPANIDISMLQQGLYLISIQDEKSVQVAKFVKE